MTTARPWKKWLRLGEWWLRVLARPSHPLTVLRLGQRMFGLRDFAARSLCTRTDLQGSSKWRAFFCMDAPPEAI